MTALDVLDALLSTDPRDVGCDAVFAAIDVYVELVVAGEDPDVRYPGVTVHLRACPPCETDFDGLVAAARAGDAPA